MPNVGYATLQVIPSVRGIADDIRRQLVAPMEDAGQDAGEAAGGGLKDKLKLGAAAAGVAAGAVLAAGIVEAMDQANITSTLQAQLGATGEDASKYGKLAGQLYSKGITENFQQGADVIRAVVNAGLAPPDATIKQLESISTKMTDVANTFGTDLSMQTQAVSALMKNNLAPSAEGALDIITVGMQKLGPNAEDLLETFQEYPVQLRKLGLDAKTSLGLFSQGLKAGARDTDIIADAFKEFSIRSIDMSAGSREAYKALGLNAAEMEAQIGKGGESARKGLDTVLDRLREMHDPVKREAAAVGLFGTQAEDLGAALFALDPSSAVKGLGKVKGAAGELAATLHSGPAHEIEVFKRSLQQGFVEFIGGQVLPVVTELGLFLNRDVVPPLKVLGSVVGAILVPALVGLLTVGAAVVGWLRDMGVWLAPLAIAIIGVTIAVNAQAIALGLLTAVMTVYSALARGVAAVTRVWAGAQALLNAVMSANPIILVVTAIVALGVALVIAYKKSETFRAIVQGAWEAIQTAALWAWTNVLKPVFEGIVAAARVAGAIFMWLWRNAISPAVGFITTALKILFVVAAVVVIGPIILWVKLLGAIFKWLWTNAISPVVGWIVAGLKLLWESVKIQFGLIRAGVRAVATAFTWLWANVIKPTFAVIVAGAKLFWAGLKIQFNLLRTYILGPLATTFRVLYNGVIKPVFAGVVATIKFAWDKGIRPTFDLVKRGVGAVQSAFRTAVSAIGKIWDGLRSATRRPVQFVIDTVYNNGIRAVWNKVAGFVGLKKLDALQFSGGGYTGPGGTLTPAGIVHAGEFVTRKTSTTRLEREHPGALDYINRTGRLPGYDKGGIVGDVIGGLTGAAKRVGGAVMSGLDFIADPGRMWDKATSFIKDKLKSIGESQWAQAVGQVPLKMLRALKDKIVSSAKGLLGNWGGGAASVASALQFARLQRGKPYGWGAVGPSAYDCSGLMGAIQGVISGQSPYVRRWATGLFGGGRAPAGWVRNLAAPFRIGITNAGVGHTAGTLMGVNVESRGGRGVLVGPGARGYNSPLFSSWYGYAPSMRASHDEGGWLRPGWNYNGLRKPEAVLSPPQWDIAKSAIAQAATPGRTINIYPRKSVIDRSDLQLIQRQEDAADRVGRPR